MAPEVLIIGASGAIGSALLRHLGERAIGTYSRSRNSHLHFFDLRTSGLTDVLGRFPSIRIVYLIGAVTGIEQCAAHPAATRTINVRGTMRVLADALERNLKIVFCSTDAVFNGIAGSYRDDDPLSPVIEYGSQKAEVEQFLRSQTGEWVIARLSKVLDYGTGGIFHSWLTDINGQIPIKCAVDQVFTPIDVDDVVASLEFLGLSRYTGVFNVGGPLAVSRYDLSVQFLKTIGVSVRAVPCKLSEFRFIEERPLNLSLNSNKLHMLFSRKFLLFSDCCQRAKQKFQASSQ